MAKIVIVSTVNSIEVDFGTYYTAPLESKRGSWRKEKISFRERANYVVANIDNEKDWQISHDGNNIDTPTFQVDLIDTVPPTSVSDLYIKLKALIS